MKTDIRTHELKQLCKEKEYRVFVDMNLLLKQTIKLSIKERVKASFFFKLFHPILYMDRRKVQISVPSWGKISLKELEKNLPFTLYKKDIGDVIFDIRGGDTI